MSSVLQIIQCNVFQKSNLIFKDSLFHQVRNKSRRPNTPKLRHPIWFIKKERTKYDQSLTKENEAFVREMVHARFGPPAIIGGVSTLALPQSVLKQEPMPRGEWSPGIRRTGLVARKIGVYPLWLKDGTSIITTLLQVVDNHVVKYIPPDEFKPALKPTRRRKMEGKFGCLLVGAESADPQMFTKDYCGLFNDSGLPPKKTLARFLIHPEAAIQPGTPLTVNHYRVGDFVDVRGFTIDRGFQGVMKRWGFSGMPASHGVTKTHRRGGNIGAGGEKSRVWPGTKMPGHMGNRANTQRGLRVLRINTKYNVLYVQGCAVPGNTNSIVYIYDTLLPLRWLKESPPFPTYYPEEETESTLPEDIYYEKVHQFSDPTLTFAPEAVGKKK